MLKKLFFLPSEFSKPLHFSITPSLVSSSLIQNRCRSVFTTHAYPSLNLLRSITSNTLFASEETAYRLRFLLNRRFYCSNPAEIRSKRRLGIGSSVISRCSHLWEKKPEIFPQNYSSLQQILKQYGDLCPEVIRRFWRVSVLQPGDFLEIIIGFSQRKDSKLLVEFLWLMFRWAPKQARDFHHLPRSYEMMISLLIKSQMLSDAECLLLSSEPRSIFFSPGKICSEIIQGYAESSLLENAVALYDKARHQGLELSSSCYLALLNLIVEMEKSELAVRVYIEMIESEFGLCDDGRFLKYVVGFLSKNGRTLEAVNILRLVRNSGLKASPETLDAVFQGYCCKKDYVDALNFLKEWVHIPPSFICNKVVSSICKSLGSEYAWFFGRELESLGFQLDDITFGILIVQSCKERKLRDGLVYLSESFSRGIKLKFYAYNSLLSGFLKEGLHKCAKDIFEEILEKGIMLDLSTFKTLLAGYFKYRKFDEIGQVLNEMVKYGFVSLAPGMDPISVALRFLDLGCLQVKIKRDNDLRAPKAEYFDSLGNGLYLETEDDEFEKLLEKIIDSAMIPEFDSILFRECKHGKLDAALMVKDEVIQWGYDLLPHTCFKFLKSMFASPCHVKVAIGFLDEKPELVYQFDCKTLNLIIQLLSKNGMTRRARSILGSMQTRGLVINDATYNAVVLGFCKEKNIKGMWECLEFLKQITYVPCIEDIKVLVNCLCTFGMVKEMFMLFDDMTEKQPILMQVFFSAILRELSLQRLGSIGCIFVEEIYKKNHAFLMDLTKIGCLTSYQFSLHYLVNLGCIEEALVLKQHLMSRKVDHATSVCKILVKEFCMVGKIMEAAFQLKELMAFGLFPDDDTLNVLVQGFCKVNNLKKAFEILGILLRTHAAISISSYRCLVRVLCHQRLFNCAVDLQKLIQLESTSMGLILNNILIFSLFQTDNSLLVNDIIDGMQKKHLIPDSSTYNFLIYGYHKCRTELKAVSIFHEMVSHGVRPNNRSLKNVIHYFCSHGKFKEAMEVSRMMASHGLQHSSSVQCSLAMGLLFQGKISEAQLLLDQLEELGLNPKNVSYDPIIKEFCVVGKLSMAVHLLDTMLKKGKLPSQSTYSTVINSFSIHKAFDEALNFHAEMLHKGLEPSVACTDTLMRGLLDCGRTENARNILGLMLQFGIVPTYDMYNFVVRKYYAENNIEKALQLLQEMQQAGYSPNFETHWSLIGNLSSSIQKDDSKSKGFLSSLLSGNGFTLKCSKEKGIHII